MSWSNIRGPEPEPSTFQGFKSDGNGIRRQTLQAKIDGWNADIVRLQAEYRAYEKQMAGTGLFLDPAHRMDLETKVGLLLSRIQGAQLELATLG
jgi:hypothetical protein